MTLRLAGCAWRCPRLWCYSRLGWTQDSAPGGAKGELPCSATSAVAAPPVFIERRDNGRGGFWLCPLWAAPWPFRASIRALLVQQADTHCSDAFFTIHAKTSAVGVVLLCTPLRVAHMVKNFSQYHRGHLLSDSFVSTSRYIAIALESACWYVVNVMKLSWFISRRWCSCLRDRAFLSSEDDVLVPSMSE